MIAAALAGCGSSGDNAAAAVGTGVVGAGSFVDTSGRFGF